MMSAGDMATHVINKAVMINATLMQKMVMHTQLQRDALGASLRSIV